jgi:hypothetical protein
MGGFHEVPQRNHTPAQHCLAPKRLRVNILDDPDQQFVNLICFTGFAPYFMV